MSKIPDNVRAFIADKKLPLLKSKVLVAVSGGPDSIALLHILYTLCDELEMELKAVHVNHMLRQNHSMADEEFVQTFCKQLGIECFCHRIDVKKLKPQGSFEETARNTRHEIYSKAASKHNCSLVALGHNANDKVETFLMRLMRGSGLKGLCSISAASTLKNLNIVRPLLCLSRKQILAYLSDNNISFRTDESNSDTQYTRNSIRHDLIPLLEKNYNPEVKKALLSTMEQIEQVNSLEEQNTQVLFGKFVRTNATCSALVKRADFFSMHHREQSLIFVKMCEFLRGPGSMVESSCVQQAIETFKSGTRGILQIPDINVYFDKTQMLVFCRSAVKPVSPLLLYPENKKINHDNLRIALSFFETMPAKEVLTAPPVRVWKAENLGKTLKLCAFVDILNIKFPLKLCGFAPGQKMNPTGFNGSRKVKKILQDMKVDGVFKESVFVIKDAADKIIWVPGYRVDNTVKLTKESKKILQIKISIDLEITRFCP